MTIQLDYLPNVAAIFMLMFARLGTMVMLLPALGESTIPTRFRLTIALALTMVLYPVGSQYYPVEVTSNTYRMIALLFGEVAIGLGIGLCAKMITSVLQIAGMIMANQSGLAFALGTDFANQGQQGALFGEAPLRLRYDRKGGASKMQVFKTIWLTLKLLGRHRVGGGRR